MLFDNLPYTKIKQRSWCYFRIEGIEGIEGNEDKVLKV